MRRGDERVTPHEALQRFDCRRFSQGKSGQKNGAREHGDGAHTDPHPGARPFNRNFHSFLLVFGSIRWFARIRAIPWVIG
jgi:hypothetical protein